MSMILSLLLVTLAAAPASAPEPLNAAAAIPGYFLAGSLKKDASALGGFSRSDNEPKPLDRNVPRNELSLVVHTWERKPFGPHRGFTVLLANSTAREFEFQASDSRLSIVREALDAKGEWREIEYLPNSWCGNSYHRVFLPAGHYWTFVAPEYAGSFRTRMRFVLRMSETERIYSNEFDGVMNPRQFDEKQELPDGGWMDPYTPQPTPAIK